MNTIDGKQEARSRRTGVLVALLALVAFALASLVGAPAAQAVPNRA